MEADVTLLKFIMGEVTINNITMAINNLNIR